MEITSVYGKPKTIIALFTQMSGLAGLFIFLQQIWGRTPLEYTLYASFGTSMAVYVVLLVGYVCVAPIISAQKNPKQSSATASEKKAKAEAA